MTTLSSIKPLTRLPFHGVLLPSITISEDDKTALGGKSITSNTEFLKRVCRDGFKKRLLPKLSKDKHKEYGDRVTFELDTIEALGFTNYILMVWDICRFADSKGIPRGPGRGSVSSSLVCHLLGISDVDPIANGLFFTRFLSKARAKTSVFDGVTYVDGGLVADIDMDFCFYRRKEVIEYIANRYPGQTSKLLTTTTLTARVLMKDVIKVYEGGNEEQARNVSDLLESEFGTPVPIEKSLYGDEKWQKDNAKGTPPNPRFVEWAKDHMETCEIAMDLEGLNLGEGQHASAVAICAVPIRTLVPMQLSSSAEGEKSVVTGYDMYDAQEIVLKFDILGLKTLSVIDDCCKAIGVNRADIDVYDPAIYDYLKDFSQRYGIFQLETFAQGNAAAKVKPQNFDQLSAVLAIARPGAFAYLGQFEEYVNKGVYKSIHPLIDDILRPTGGVCLFQEQFLLMLVRVGLTPDEAEAIRKIVGKKLKEKIPEAIAKIRDVCAKNGHPEMLVDLLMKIAEESGGYSFAKCLHPDTVVGVIREDAAVNCYLWSVKVGDLVRAYDVNSNTDHYVKVLNVYKTESTLYEVSFIDGTTLTCSMDHRLLCRDFMMRPLKEVIAGGWTVVTKTLVQGISRVSRSFSRAAIDIEVDYPDHNFYANGVVVSNCHADAYAMISAITIYLKVKHPLQFFWSLLRMARRESDKYEKLAMIEQEMRAAGYQLYPPDLVKSSMEFKIEDNGIRFALGMIRGISDKNEDKLKTFLGSDALTAESNKFQIFQSLKNAGLNIGIGSSLIQAGCMSGYETYGEKAGKPHQSRSRLVLELLAWNLLSDREKTICLTIGSKPEVSWDVLEAIAYLRDHLDEKGKPLFSRATRFNTIFKKYEPYKAIYLQNKRHEALANFFYERTVLGYSYSQNVRQLFADRADDLVSIAEVKNMDNDEQCRLVGFIKDPKKSKTKAGNDQLSFMVTDETGEIRVRMFNKWIALAEEEAERPLTEEDLVIMDCTKKEGDTVFANRVSVQSAKIYMKLSELKDDAMKGAKNTTIEIETAEIVVTEPVLAAQ